VKLLTFDEYLKKKLQDQYFRGGYDAWHDAIRDEIRPRDREIRKLRKKLDCLKKRNPRKK